MSESSVIQRLGKTRKDRESGARERNWANKQARASWMGNKRSDAFPRMSCNGKKNRYRVTGKGGSEQILDGVGNVIGGRT